MSIVLLDEFRIDERFIVPPKIRNGTFAPIHPLQNLINYELLLVLNGKAVGYTLDFTKDINRRINAYQYYNRKQRFTDGERQQIDDIFTLSETNGMLFVPAETDNWGIYFLEENTNKGMLLAYFLRRFNTGTLVANYIISRLQGYEIEDIEANLFCYRNGTNLVEERRRNERNLNHIINTGNRFINKIQQSQGFINFVTRNPPQPFSLNS